MSNVISIRSRKRPGAIAVRTEFFHHGAWSIVRFIDPSGVHPFEMPYAAAVALQRAYADNPGNELAFIVAFIERWRV